MHFPNLATGEAVGQIVNVYRDLYGCYCHVKGVSGYYYLRPVETLRPATDEERHAYLSALLSR